MHQVSDSRIQTNKVSTRRADSDGIRNNLLRRTGLNDLVPADVNVFAVRVGFRVGVVCNTRTVERHAQHIQRERFVAECLNTLEELLFAARVRPDNQQGVRQIRTGIRFYQLVLVTGHAQGAGETAIFFTPGVNTRFTGADHLAGDLVHIQHIGQQAQELRTLQQGIAQLGGAYCRFPSLTT